MDRLLRLIPLAFALALCACTTMGTPDTTARQMHDFGKPVTVDVCLYLDNGIAEEEGRKLIEEAWRDEAPLYGIDVRVAKVERWARPAFQMEGILADLRQKRLDAPCDRIMALVGRNVGDTLWSFFGPEVLGAVNDETLTHGYTVARRASLNQVLTPPVDIARHELYHLLGCGEHSNMPKCYDQLAMLKAWQRDHDSDFFPAWDLVNGRLLGSREAVNVRLSGVIERAVAAK